MATRLPVLPGSGLSLRPMSAEEIAGLARRIGSDPIAARWWSAKEETNARWLEEMLDGAFVIEVEGQDAGVIAFEHNDDPAYSFASIDIALFDEFTGRGLGPEAIWVLARWLIDETGRHRLTIDPALANEHAISAYRKVGFRDVGVMREYQRADDGTWEDGLLMDMLAGELTRPLRRTS